jgi:fluoroquinolone transport system permease protein
MARLRILVQGELDRLKKYNLFTATTVVLLLWVGMTWLLEAEEIAAFVPLILLMDSTAMTVALVGATLFYEKKEHTINSILVTPVREAEYILAKVIVSIINSLLTLIALAAAVYFLKGVTFNCVQAAAAVVIITVFHTLLAIWFAYFSKNFTSLLVNFMLYVLILMLPGVLADLGVIGEKISRFFLILPPDAAGTILKAGFVTVELWKIVFGFVYLAALSLALYKWIIKPRFNDYAMRETGV